MGLDRIVWLGIEYAPPADSGAPGERSGSTHFGAARTMWGVPLKEINTGTATYHEFGTPPLAQYDTPESLETYPFWPDPEYFDYDGLTQAAADASNDFAVTAPWVSFYEIYCQMRGLESALTDLLALPDLADAILDRIESIQTAMLKRLLKQAAPYLDMVFVSDDMGAQNGLLFGVETWDRFFKARMERWCELIHSFGLKVFYHSDGACAALIPRLIDAGIDVLNPIQHACPGMELASLKKAYGDQLVFHGGIDNQYVLPFGTPEEVREETRRCLRTLGAGKEGYICSSCHNVQAGTPVENILAMVETVLQEG